MPKKAQVSAVASQFFEEDTDASSAKARRLARSQGKPVEVSQPVPPKKEVDDAKARRLKRQEAKPPVKKVEKDAPSPIGASATHVPETGIATSWKKSWECCLEDDKWVCYADGKKVLSLSCKGAGKI